MSDLNNVHGFKFLDQPTQDPNWKCYLYGSDPIKGYGMVYHPPEGQIPNWFVRWMMKVMLGCTWVKTDE